MISAEKHKRTIEESATRLLSRATNSRQLEVSDLEPRLFASVGKYVLRDNENASNIEIKQFIDALAADDLCLIIACEKNDESAWNDLVKSFDGTVKSAARKISNNTEDAEDLASSIWAELHGLKRDAQGNIKTKLAYYSGRGSLAGWLRAVVAQMAVDGFRKISKFVQIEEAREFENLAKDSAEKPDNNSFLAAAENPEEAFAAKESKADVAAALNEAIAALAPEDKLILKLYYFDDLKLKDIGGALGFHEATASRRIARIQTDLRKSVERILTKKGWRREDVKRSLAETAAKLDIGVEKMLMILFVCALLQEIFRRAF